MAQHLPHTHLFTCCVQAAFDQLCTLAHTRALLPPPSQVDRASCLLSSGAGLSQADIVKRTYERPRGRSLPKWNGSANVTVRRPPPPPLATAAATAASAWGSLGGGLTEQVHSFVFRFLRGCQGVIQTTYCAVIVAHRPSCQRLDVWRVYISELNDGSARFGSFGSLRGCATGQFAIDRRFVQP